VLQIPDQILDPVRTVVKIGAAAERLVEASLAVVLGAPP
jgi:hypothetical protein